MYDCHCGSGQTYDACCGPILNGQRDAPTAEALMRARYSAYVEQQIDFLGDTLHPDHRADWDRDATRKWAEQSSWQGLEIRRTQGGGEQDEEGQVEFLARFEEGGEPRLHHENSLFRRHGGRWYYVSGDLPKPTTLRKAEPKVGRNEPCPCGSGRKYKKCCGR